MVLGWELDMASEIASQYLEMVTGLVSELEIASGMAPESKLIMHICFEEIQDIW